MTTLENLEKLTLWAEEKGYIVDFCKDCADSIDGDVKHIQINSSDKLDVQLISLLHECGHLLIYQYDPLNLSNKKYSFGKNSFKRRVYTILEEVEAWNRAQSLAKRLNIELDQALWEKEKIKALGQYIKWAGGDKKYSIGE